MTDAWEPEPDRPGVLSRLLVPSAGARPATTALVLGIVAVVAFVASLVLDWQRVTQTIPGGGTFSLSPGDEFTMVATPGTVDTLGQVYLLGMIAMLGLLGAVLTRPDLALRGRMAATGVGVGLLGVVVATMLRFPDSTANSFAGLFGNRARLDELRASQAIAYEPGVAAAVVAVVVAVAAIWLAAGPAVRALAAVPAPATRFAVVEAPAPAARQSGQVGHVGELSVSPSEPVDLTVTPDAWPR